MSSDNCINQNNTEINQDNTQIYQGFIVKDVCIPTPTGMIERPYIFIKKDETDPIISSMINTLQDITELEELYDSEIQISPQDLYPHLKTIQNKVDAGDFTLIELLVYLNSYFRSKLEQLDNMTKSNKINFDNLNTVFTVGTKFVGYIHNNQMVGSMVQDTDTVKTMQGRMFQITGVCNMPVGSELRQITKNFYIQEFGGVRSIEDLDVRPMNHEDEEFLKARGETFRRFSSGTYYWGYQGNMCVKSMYGYQHFKADGRIMIDSTGFDKSNPSYLNSVKSNSNKLHSINEENITMCWPYLYGFSFTAKRWGELYIDHLKEIQFDDNAFDYLVLDTNIKRMMKSLIVNVKHSFKDIIGGKSGGCIFLLHGPPGVGKTLTCEAVAELLHKPLYSITVGELGTDVDTLETRLNNILEIANSWDAVILIDEADIFMEARNKNDIERNGMVSIFLRLLERHQGVMFLTTNRNQDLDPAFKSRISIISGYENLDLDSRTKVWTNLLNAASIKMTSNEIQKLSSYEVNGRQIKNLIRMAQSMIMDKEYNPESRKLEMNDIELMMKFM